MVTTNIIKDYGNKISLQKSVIKKIIKDLLSTQNILDAQVSIVLSNKLLLNKLKKDYFNLDYFTDVIVFNLEGSDETLDGEIYISIDDVQENAIEFNQTFNNEFIRVLIHGLLHLIGYKDDNNTNKKNMRSLENKYLTLNIVSIISLS